MAWRKVWKTQEEGRSEGCVVDPLVRRRGKNAVEDDAQHGRNGRRGVPPHGAGPQRRQSRPAAEDSLAGLLREPWQTSPATGGRGRSNDYQGVLEALTAVYRPERPDELTPHRLREFVRGEPTNARRPATRNKLIRTLRAIFSWAVPEYLKENPAKSVKFAKEPEQDRRTLTPAELVKVLSAADARGQAVLLRGPAAGFAARRSLCCGGRTWTRRLAGFTLRTANGIRPRAGSNGASSCRRLFRRWRGLIASGTANSCSPSSTRVTTTPGRGAEGVVPPVQRRAATGTSSR